MAHQAAVPFHLRRSQDAFSGGSVTSTTEVVHGLLRLDGDRVVVQWRLARQTEHVGAMSVRTDAELEAVRQIEIPLAGVAGAIVRRRWWAPWGSPTLILRAADLRAFEEVAGESGLKLGHPAELILGLRRTDLLVAEEFSAELAMALAERALAADEAASPLPRPEPLPKLAPPAPEETR